MGLSGKDDYVGIDVIIIVFEAPYRWTVRDFFCWVNDSLGVFHSKT